MAERDPQGEPIPTGPQHRHLEDASSFINEQITSDKVSIELIFISFQNRSFIYVFFATLMCFHDLVMVTAGCCAHGCRSTWASGLVTAG